MKDFEVDISELEELATDLGVTMKDMVIYKDMMARDIGQKFVDSAKRNTPVDTGHLRRNWNIKNITAKKLGRQYVIYNPVEYAEYVDKGHRTVGTPSGFVEGFDFTGKATRFAQSRSKKIGKTILEDLLKRRLER